MSCSSGVIRNLEKIYPRRRSDVGDAALTPLERVTQFDELLKVISFAHD